MTIVLHHYPGSLFSEKIRAMFGYLDVSWQSVEISPVMPRPLLMPLSGGYRRTPIMQIDANVYCDTNSIARRLASAAEGKDLIPERDRFRVQRLAEWADSHLFQVVVAISFQPKAVMATMDSLSQTEIEAFMKDRAELSAGATISSYPPADAEAYFEQYLRDLDDTIGSEFLFGQEPVLSDFSVYHCLWLVLQNPVVAPQVNRFFSVRAWMDRIAAFGHGKREDIEAEDALELARRSEPVLPSDVDSLLPEGVALGQNVSVTPVDYGKVPVSGELLACSDEEIAIKRNEPQTGDVVVHFPRTGFTIAPA